MLVVAFPPSLWTATLRTLRELTRVAATALVLVVGLTGPAAASPATGTVRPAATTRPAADVPAAPAPVGGPARVAPGATVDAGLRWGTSTRLAGIGPASASRPDSPAGRPLAAAAPPASDMAARPADGDAAPPRPDVAVVARDAARVSVARRGPPHA